MSVISRSWVAPKTATPPRKNIGIWKTGSDSSNDKSTAAVAALGARAPLLYGQVQTKGLIAAVQVATTAPNAGLYLLVVWGEGPITAIDGLVTEGSPSTLYHADYLGTPDQDVDPWLAAVIPAYSDTLRGTYNQRQIALAYSVIKTTDGANFPAAPTALIRGLSLYDPRTGLSAYSTNPALILADVLTRAGETVDWAASQAAFDYCDEVVGETQARWTCSLIIADPADVYSHAEMLRGYAHCLIDHTATGIRLVPDSPASVSRALTASDVIAGSLILSRPARRDTPTYVRVGFTDTAPPAGTPGGPWGTRYASAEHPGIITGAAAWIESGLTLPGIQFFQEASRTAIERLNAYTLRNLLAEAIIRDEGLAVAVGDVVTLTHPLGLDAKPLRVLAVDDQSPGRYRVQLEEYDPAVYSSAIVAEPTYADTPLPSPFDVPAPTDLAAVEEVYRLLDGTYATRLRLSWAGAVYPYAKRYDARLETAGMLAWSTSGPDTDATTTEVIPGQSYQAKVRIVAAIGLSGPWTSLAITIVGRNYPPTDVARLAAVEIGGEVRLSWPAALDTDIWRYEIRYGTTTWEAATLLDRVDSLRCMTRDVPAGDWLFFVKALDAIGQYSATAAVKAVTVTLDAASFFVGSFVAGVAPGATNVFSVTDRYGNLTAWSEESGLTVNDVFTATANTYTQPICTYATDAASELVSTTWDLGDIGTADNFAGTLTADLDGTVATVGSMAATVQTSLNNADWTDAAGNPVNTTLAYARVTVAAAAGHGFLLRTAPTLRLDVLAREEAGRIAASATGPAVVSLLNHYATIKSLVLTPGGTAPRTAVYDNIDLTTTPNTFDVYLFDANNDQIAGDVSYRFLGV